MTATSTSLANTNGLPGPQCLTCRKRRVRCDSLTPKCQRCTRDALPCPGYTKPLTIIRYRPSRSQHNPLATKTTTNMTRPVPEDQDILTVLDAIRCYNEYVIPDTSPAHRPFQRLIIGADVPWHLMPKVVQYFFVVTLRSLQAAKNGVDPLATRDVCHYRGRGMGELRNYLATVGEEPFGIALACVIMAMAAELQVPGAGCGKGGEWILHFKAAGRILDLRGGMEVCWERLPSVRGPLVNYLVADVFTATTCPGNMVFDGTSARERHEDYIDLLPKVESELLANACICPVDILRVIAKINLLRSSGRAWDMSLSSMDGADEVLFMIEFRKILDCIECFDPGAWAVRMLQYGQPLPHPPQNSPALSNVKAFTALGLCFQNASLIYLVLSSTSSYSQTLRQMVASATRTVHEKSKELLTMASQDPDAVVCKRLWKFLGWPLAMALYAQIGWHAGAVEQNTDVTKRFDFLRSCAKKFNYRVLLDVLNFMRDVERKKMENGTQAWVWDDAFDTKHAFAI